MAIRKSSNSGIPFGNTAGRPTNPVIGQTYYNGQVEALEIYNGTTWKVSKSEGFPPDTPTISSVTDSSTSLAYSSTAGTLDVLFVPAGTGGTATQYNALTTAGGHSGFTTVGSTVTITGLTPGTAYTVYGNAQNGSGTSTNAANAAAVTPTTLPQSPTIGTATLSGTDAIVTWTLGNNGAKSLSSITITPYIGLTAQSPVNAASTSSTSHTFTGITGGSTYTFKVKATNANGTSLESAASSSVFVPGYVTFDYLVVGGGGGGGGSHNSAGGGAGGLRSTVTNTGGGGTLETAVSVLQGTVLTISVGAGGAQSGDGSGAGIGFPGNNSYISGAGITTITSLGGGNGGSSGVEPTGVFGSGGGNSGYTTSTPNNATAGQGFRGGAGGNYGAGGGGGAGQVGGNGTSTEGGVGGNGVSVAITGAAVTYAGGGGGADYTGSGGNAGGAGGGGLGGGGNSSSSLPIPTAGTANLGGGGGGNNNYGSHRFGMAGGSGIVVIKLAAAAASTTGSPVNPSTGVYVFNNNGTLTV